MNIQREYMLLGNGTKNLLDIWLPQTFDLEESGICEMQLSTIKQDCHYLLNKDDNYLNRNIHKQVDILIS